MYEIVVKMVAWFPRPPQRATEGTLYVRSETGCMLVALDAKDQRLWVANCDHVIRWTMEHARHVQRWSDDQKAEQRPLASFQSRREASAEKYRRRMDSAVKEIAAQLTGFAARRKLAIIVYDDAIHSYCERFPWAALCSRIKVKCDELGILFERSNGVKNAGAARSDANTED